MKNTHMLGSYAWKVFAASALSLSLAPGLAFAADEAGTQALNDAQAQAGNIVADNDPAAELMSKLEAYGEKVSKSAISANEAAEADTPIKSAQSAAADAVAKAEKKKAAKKKAATKAEPAAKEKASKASAKSASKKKQQVDKANKLLEYDRSLIEQIGTQEQTGHTICCPSFSCAYADAVMDGTVHDHDYYTCSWCTWTDWGGGGSADRYVGTDEELLREAYDQISKGKPTVIHVAAGYGEHWIALIGYENAIDPDHLTLSNFIALDPWDGSQINAGDNFVLYGDGCEHISDR